MRERLYDAACLITCSEESGLRGQYTEPVDELLFGALVASLQGKLAGARRLSDSQ